MPVADCSHSPLTSRGEDFEKICKNGIRVGVSALRAGMCCIGVEEGSGDRFANDSGGQMTLNMLNACGHAVELLSLSMQPTNLKKC